MKKYIKIWQNEGKIKILQTRNIVVIIEIVSKIMYSIYYLINLLK